MMMVFREISEKKYGLYNSSIICICVLICFSLSFSGCSYVNPPSIPSNHPSLPENLSPQSNNTPVTKSGTYFDTVISITLYGSDKEKYIDACFEIADTYERLFSKSIAESDVSRVNNSNTEFVKVSDDTIKILTESLKYSALSEGRFSLVCGALTSLWDIKDNETIPDEKAIKEAMLLVGDDKIEIKEETNEVRITKPGVKLDFGAAAKGYIADRMKEYLISEGVFSGVISLGGNVLLIGEKPDTRQGIRNNNQSDEAGLYTVGIAKPFSKSDEMITALHVKDTSVVTSGSYQRYFMADDKIYHHIIDLTTGYPADTGLNSVSIICPSSLEADIMSTTCYLLGEQKGIRLAESLDINSIFVSSDNEIVYADVY